MNDSTLHSNRFEELCAGYVLDALEADEIREFEEMLDDASEDEQQTYLSFRSSANQLAFAVDRSEPSEAVKTRIMQQIRSTQAGEEDSAGMMKEEKVDEKEEENKGFGRYTMAMAASIILLLATLALVGYVISQKSRINNQQAKIAKLQNQLSILGARSVDVVMMNGLDVNPNGYGKIIWDAKKQQALLQVANLPAISGNKDYQLWLIKNNKPIPSGVFHINTSSKNEFFKISQLANATEKNANSFAITLEPKGGSPTGKPTGDMYMLGNVKK